MTQRVKHKILHCFSFFFFCFFLFSLISFYVWHSFCAELCSKRNRKSHVMLFTIRLRSKDCFIFLLRCFFSSPYSNEICIRTVDRIEMETSVTTEMLNAQLQFLFCSNFVSFFFLSFFNFIYFLCVFFFFFIWKKKKKLPQVKYIESLLLLLCVFHALANKQQMAIKLLLLKQVHEQCVCMDFILPVIFGSNQKSIEFIYLL